MKSKLFSVMLFVAAVLFVGAIGAPQAADIDIEQTEIEQVVSLDQLSVDSAVAVEAPQFTPSAGSLQVAICYEGDMDHQRIEQEIIQHAMRSDIERMRPYLARSSLYNAGLFA